MPWHARLQLDYSFESPGSVTRYRHEGPLRVLQSLYPEGDAVCHNVLVHPPGGLVSGDTLDIAVSASGTSHGLITTPGATRFYRSSGDVAVQRTRITVRDQARIEWLPMEALCYDGCVAENHLQIELDPQSEAMAWDLSALGLPQAQLPFERGQLLQRIEIPGLWLEQGRLDAADTRLMAGPVGLDGHRCMATIFFASGTKMERGRRERALDAARAVLDAHALRLTAGATSPNEQVVVVRVLAPLVEPAMDLLKQVWLTWRSELWGLPGTSPRIWAM
jgi:urease accessory protein